MPASPLNALVALFLLLALLPLAMTVRNAVFRLTAGPVRFQLALASQAVGWVQTPAYPLFVIVFSPFLLAGTAPLTLAGKLLLGTIWVLWTFAYTLSLASRRRHAKRWLVLAAGLLSVLMGAVVLGFAVWAYRAGNNAQDHLAGLWVFLFSLIFFAIGAGALQEYASGTQVRKRGIEMFSTGFPWSRVSVRGWQTREYGFDLCLAVRPFRLVTWPYYDRDSEFIVPVALSEWPALEVFLIAHTATWPTVRA